MSTSSASRALYHKPVSLFGWGLTNWTAPGKLGIREVDPERPQSRTFEGDRYRVLAADETPIICVGSQRAPRALRQSPSQWSTLE